MTANGTTLHCGKRTVSVTKTSLCLGKFFDAPDHRKVQDEKPYREPPGNLKNECHFMGFSSKIKLRMWRRQVQAGSDAKKVDYRKLRI
jgi:hypothetical protein